MSSSGESVRVNICGDEYSIKTDIDKETTKEIAEFVNQKMMEVKKGSSIRESSKIAVLSALNIAGELFEYRIKSEKTQQEFSDLQEKAGTLCKKIEKYLSE
jgi:cell division protein ZapA